MRSQRSPRTALRAAHAAEPRPAARAAKGSREGSKSGEARQETGGAACRLGICIQEEEEKEDRVAVATPGASYEQSSGHGRHSARRCFGSIAVLLFSQLVGQEKLIDTSVTYINLSDRTKTRSKIRECERQERERYERDMEGK